MGALHLKPLDDQMQGLDCFCARFMDDWVIIAPTRWKLRKAVRDIIGHAPHWIIRWGITVIFSIMLALLALSWIFKYPDLVSASDPAP